MQKSISILLALFITVSINAQSYQPPYFADGDRLKKVTATFPLIDKLFKDQAERAHYPAFAYGLVLDGKLIFTGYTGYTDLDRKVAANAGSVFRIASMSKSFTCMAIVKLR